jgi:hypothetical protein
MPLKMFRIESQGESPVSRNNASFTCFCAELDVVDAMEVGQTRSIRFASGAGKNTLEVTRLADREDPIPA